MLDLTKLSQKHVSAPTAFVHDTDSAHFEQDVLAVSLEMPVIVDFWATWCGPCKQMLPVLEKIVTEAAGTVRLVRVDVDKNQELAQIFRVQSVPMVYAFFQGKPVDGFTGTKPESELRAFVDKLKQLAGIAVERPLVVADVSADLARAAAFFKEEKYIDAMTAYSTALDAAPENMEAMAGLGWCLVADGNAEALAELIEQLSPEQKDHPRIKGLSVVLRDVSKLETSDQLLAKLSENPKNHAARYDLAQRKLAAADVPGAIDELVELTRRDREWEKQKARSFLIEIFEALGAGHPWAAVGRRKLSVVLFS